nr:unnamed protein product [Naegleria fowleri]
MCSSPHLSHACAIAHFSTITSMKTPQASMITNKQHDPPPPQQPQQQHDDDDSPRRDTNNSLLLHSAVVLNNQRKSLPSPPRGTTTTDMSFCSSSSTHSCGRVVDLEPQKEPSCFSTTTTHVDAHSTKSTTNIHQEKLLENTQIQQQKETSSPPSPLLLLLSTTNNTQMQRSGQQQDRPNPSTTTPPLPTFRVESSSCVSNNNISFHTTSKTSLFDHQQLEHVPLPLLHQQLSPPKTTTKDPSKIQRCKSAGNLGAEIKQSPSSRPLSSPLSPSPQQHANTTNTALVIDKNYLDQYGSRKDPPPSNLSSSPSHHEPEGLTTRFRTVPKDHKNNLPPKTSSTTTTGSHTSRLSPPHSSSVIDWSSMHEEKANTIFHAAFSKQQERTRTTSSIIPSLHQDSAFQNNPSLSPSHHHQQPANAHVSTTTLTSMNPSNVVVIDSSSMIHASNDDDSGSSSSSNRNMIKSSSPCMYYYYSSPQPPTSFSSLSMISSQHEKVVNMPTPSSSSSTTSSPSMINLPSTTSPSITTTTTPPPPITTTSASTTTTSLSTRRKQPLLASSSTHSHSSIIGGNPSPYETHVLFMSNEHASSSSLHKRKTLISKSELLRVLHLPQTQASTVLKCSLSTLKRRFYELKDELGMEKWPQFYDEIRHLPIFPLVYPMSFQFIFNPPKISSKRKKRNVSKNVGNASIFFVDGGGNEEITKEWSQQVISDEEVRNHFFKVCMEMAASSHVTSVASSSTSPNG